ncbi:DEAD/DEAH box helicase [Lacticaseibacillus sharpeae]|uniref:DEAD-box ATP-dependent RNA helicase CshB n=1 Tax=Lacticaseibacillus sharpeae JCM 1186 = DSM 20505 TaxID=1291052 RepID=A0A0R1ZK60_9LACO|nr:DEAD/DEAH box helicase [Lacticaseibacillus sharpeae]KRM54722.1 ATP-dependent RNA helicase [Lacticaseibacillus sharpeae JCM 1186 = DSM 20505]
MDNKFNQYNLSPDLITALTANKFVEPTPIQTQVIPKALKGQSIIGQSQTGSGKTLAFLLPLLSNIDRTSDTLQAVITAPSRELATQIYKTAQLLLKDIGDIRVGRYVGGTDRQKQEKKLTGKSVHLAIGTPGRIRDLIQDGALTGYTVKTFVVDEADMTLDMGFLDTVDKIASTFPAELQMMVFSATIPQKLQPFLKKYMHNPLVIELKPKTVIADTVENLLIAKKGKSANELIYKLLTIGQPYLVLIFANTKEAVDKLHAYLTEQGLEVAKIHGDIAPRERKRVMKDVAAGRYQYVVATDLAARGIDINGVSHVINAEIPTDPEFFIHRVGRTGRNGMTGTAITLYAPGEENKIGELESMGIHFQPKTIHDGEIIDAKDRNRRQNREKKSDKLSQTMYGMLQKEKKKKKPGYKKKVKKAIAKEEWFNRRVEKRAELRAAKRKNKAKGLNKA